MALVEGVNSISTKCLDFWTALLCCWSWGGSSCEPQHKAAREMCLERSVQGPYSSQHMCKLGRTGLVGKVKLLRLLHCPGKGEKESQAEMGTLVSDISPKVMVDSQPCGPLWWTSAGISFGNKEQQYKAGEAELQLGNQHCSASPSRSTGPSISACLALYPTQINGNDEILLVVLHMAQGEKESLEEGRGSKPLMGQNLHYQGNREGEGSPGGGKDHLSQPLALAERRMEIRASCL